MAFAPDFLDELRARVNLPELVGRRVSLKRRGGQEWLGLCPFHNEKTPSFTVNEGKGFYHCFGCGAHGGALDFVMNTEGLSFPEAVERLAREAGLELPAPDPEAHAQASRRKGLIELLEAATRWFQAQLAAGTGAEARRYLERRGLSDAAIAQFRLGYAVDAPGGLLGAMQARGFAEEQLFEVGLLRRPEDGREAYDFFRHRIIFPIAERQGRIIAFGGRALGEARAKYLNSPESALFHKGLTLYNLDRARTAAHEAGAVIVAEGYMDVIALHRAGLAHAVAPLGTALTEEQLRTLWRLAPEPVLCFDGDAAGQRAAIRAAERALPLLEPGRSLAFVELPPGQDPDDLLRSQGPAALRALLEAPLPLVEVLWRQAIAGRRLDTPERRAGLRRDLAQAAAGIRDDTVRAYYRQHFEAALDRLLGPPAAGRRARTGGRGEIARRLALARPLARHRGLGPAEALGRGRERLLMALVLNHPGLLDEVFEAFAGLRFGTPELDRLHKLLLERVGLRQALDVALLTHDLTDKALSEAVGELTGRAAAGLPPEATAGASLDQARRGWHAVYGMHRLPALEADLRDAEAAFGEVPTDENWVRLRAVQAELERARSEATRGGGLESDVAGLV
jgi:DNA primase